ncbi:MAG TPA: hypothetical protein PL028_02000 [Bacteroidales bacterium]|nr:hypothetical protein [Bacteroidales bacterium]
MNALLILAVLYVTIIIISIVALYKMIIAIDKRIYMLQEAFNNSLKTLDDQLKTLYERVNNIDSRIPIIIGWCETLRENQNILQGDLEKVFYGTRKEIRKIEKQKERLANSEEKKLV